MRRTCGAAVNSHELVLCTIGVHSQHGAKHTSLLVSFLSGFSTQYEMHVTVREWSMGESTTCCSAACPVVVVVVVGSGKQNCLFVAFEKPTCSCVVQVAR